MKRAALLVVALGLVFAQAALAGGRPSESAIETKLVCPECHETLDESNSAIAQQMKLTIRRELAAGWSEKRILDQMVANFGPGVLSTPADHGFDLLAWVLPIGGALIGVAALALAARYWTRSGGSPPLGGPPLDPELERRIDAELARFDG
ncbi:MAG TPA: cytochrome c-type biogenesis protein CcmH [Gaiellaceae bacterium]|nr:cytochrome c-type biogenesis protein CcmH [Gaiellaceae bacterium]